MGILQEGDRGDGAEWSVALTGDRLHDADEGVRLTVTGTLRVIRHPQRSSVGGGVKVPEWVEVRVTDG